MLNVGASGTGASAMCKSDDLSQRRNMRSGIRLLGTCSMASQRSIRPISFGTRTQLCPGPYRLAPRSRNAFPPQLCPSPCLSGRHLGSWTCSHIMRSRNDLSCAQVFTDWHLGRTRLPHLHCVQALLRRADTSAVSLVPQRGRLYLRFRCGPGVFGKAIHMHMPCMFSEPCIRVCSIGAIYSAQISIIPSAWPSTSPAMAPFLLRQWTTRLEKVRTRRDKNLSRFGSRTHLRVSRAKMAIDTKLRTS